MAARPSRLRYMSIVASACMVAALAYRLPYESEETICESASFAF